LFGHDRVEADPGDVEEKTAFQLSRIDRFRPSVDCDVPASAVPTSLIVPSPPHAITMRAPASTAALAISAA